MSDVHFQAPFAGTSIAPWLPVRGRDRAAEFYQAAFGATVLYRPEGGVVARLSVQGAEFWVAEESPRMEAAGPGPLPPNAVRLILTVEAPDAVFAQALRAGATEVYPVSEGHGWRVGRIADPDGHHWEIGRPIAADSAD